MFIPLYTARNMNICSIRVYKNIYILVPTYTNNFVYVKVHTSGLATLSHTYDSVQVDSVCACLCEHICVKQPEE